MSTMFNMIGGAGIPNSPLSPVQRMQAFMQAMQNPAMYLKQKFPDIPDYMLNDPGAIMQYLQHTRGISGQDIQNAQAQMMQGGK